MIVIKLYCRHYRWIVNLSNGKVVCSPWFISLVILCNDRPLSRLIQELRLMFNAWHCSFEYSEAQREPTHSIACSNLAIIHKATTVHVDRMIERRLGTHVLLQPSFLARCDASRGSHDISSAELLVWSKDFPLINFLFRYPRCMSFGNRN
jgi:hypothetical protein